MTYREMQQAEAELNAAIAPAKRRRAAKVRPPQDHCCVYCGRPFGEHTLQETVDCSNARS